MFNLDSINTLAPEGIIILNDLLPIAKKSIEVAKQIQETYLFHIGEEKIEVWHDDYNHEYLTRDGVWQARYLHQTYDVECTANSIFEYMKTAYLIENGYVKEFEENRYTTEGEKACIFKYFNSFIEKTAELHAAKTNNT